MKPKIAIHIHTKKKIIATKEALMWGYSIEFWGAAVRVTTILAFGFGGLAVTAGFLSGWIGYHLSETVQQQSTERMAEAEARIAEANAIAAQANERTAELEVQAATLQAELATRTQPLVARTITNEQAATLAAVLMGRMVAVTLMYLSGDAETTEYVSQLRAALIGAGANVSGNGLVGAVELPSGLTLTGPENEALTNVGNALEEADITFRYIPNDPIPGIAPAPGSLKIIVGQREQLSN